MDALFGRLSQMLVNYVKLGHRVTGDPLEFFEHVKAKMSNTDVFFLPCAPFPARGTVGSRVCRRVPWCAVNFRGDDSVCDGEEGDGNGCTLADSKAGRARFPFRAFVNEEGMEETISVTGISLVFQLLVAKSATCAAAGPDVDVATALKINMDAAVSQWEQQLRQD